jgi:transcriptional regulator with XRE-family HTH domain
MPDKKLTPEEIAANRRAVQHVSEWLRYRDYTQIKLADSLGVSKATISKWLSGTQGMSVAQFLDIARFCDCRPEELMMSPNHRETAIRYRRLAEALNGMPEDRFDAVVAGLLAMIPKD